MRRRGVAVIAAFVAAGGLAACGGGERQDENEPEGSFVVDVDASFPLQQRLAKQEEMEITVRNADSKELPNVAVTVDSFSRQSQQQGLADPERPVWIVDNGPRGGGTAYTNTWSLGKLGPGQTKTFTWRVTPVVPGSQRVTYRVAAGLDGKATAQLEGGGDPKGEFAVRISDNPSQARVNPRTGEVERSGE